MKNTTIPRTLAAAFACAAAVAHADVTIGISMSQTGPSASLGIPQKNSLPFWPEKIGNEKLRVVVLDDASDPTTATKNARKFVSEEKVDIILGSSSVAPSIAMSEVAAEGKTVQIAFSPIELPKGKGEWTYRIAQPVGLMATSIVQRMRADKIKTVGFIGFADAYGETWLKEFTLRAESAGIQIVGVERYARADTSVMGQAIKLVAARPQAVFIAGAGTAAALPQTTLRERGFTGPIYQTHGAATKDLIRVGGKAVEGTVLTAGPVLVAEQLEKGNPVKGPATDYVTRYEKQYGPDSRTQFGAHAYDAQLVLQRIVPVALKKAKPGTPEFRQALKDALESERDIVISHGVLNYSATDHYGFDQRGVAVVKVENGKWVLQK
ncbi:ABC transporter substrate-binding protein [Piscinibacter gummiphilus]|uniref:Branched-chain amino acid ABC transporter substrate-binding protein n=1 Tax=Piscinibacter gummiphilus TaxID=946333 RepID=A0A1W6L9K7_9BURK|nr:ABC transporter substrate-binding protein [Piscinibacter gummiphilus]ARN20991.1 branched-chain amino acid ABC transporter substrate-binding protein [Piscinibacter gummiphilus]ATU65666.1 branched-chain amino acid ABC transporter substrate-binding protein [Piscinibacter gummiphilus]GLS93524.1 branched-chain amino acid ABC transporter substrate-binding protein [Piscinibacter gummiphilus]